MGRGLTYDAENRLTAAGNDSYLYDPSGHRVWKLIGPDNFFTNWSNNDEFFFYGINGQRLGTYKFTAQASPALQGYWANVEMTTTSAAG